MRLLLLFIFAMVHGMGTCSLSFANTLKAKGQAESDSAYSDVFRLETPNKSLTKIGDKKVLLETGNKNWLANPNFAAPMVSTALPGWLKHSGVSWSLEADGTSANKVLKTSIGAATYSNDDLVFYSDLITSKGDNTGKNLIGKMWIKSANTGYKLCAIVDSVTQHCTDIIADSTRYIEYKTPIFSGGGDSTEYRLGIYHKAHTAGSTQDLYHKEAYLGPTDIAMGTIVTDWKTASISTQPTGLGSGSGTYNSVKYRQVGDSADIEIRWTKDATSGTGATQVKFPFPDGLTPNVGTTSIGQVFVNNATGDKELTAYATSTGMEIYVGGAILTGSQVSANTIWIINIKVPIQGWTSGARVSDGYDAQDVVATVKFQADNQTINAGLQRTLAFSVVEKDTAIGFNSSTYIYTVKSAGFYRVSVSGRWVSSTTSQDKNLIITMGGANYLVDIVNNTQYSSTKGTKTVYLTPGQTIYAQGGNADGTNSIQFQGSSGWLEIEKKSGAAYITPMSGDLRIKQGLWTYTAARATCSSASSMTTNTGFASIANAVDNGTNRSCVLTFSSAFSATAVCTANILQGAPVDAAPLGVIANASSMTVVGPDSDYSFTVSCSGPQ